MSHQYQILFVCMGNICRSPAGEAVLRKMVDEQGLGGQILIDSAGTIGFHTGNAPDRRMHKAAAKRGIQTGGRARQVQLHDLDEFDRVLAMDDENYEDLKHLASNPGQLGKVKRFANTAKNTWNTTKSPTSTTAGTPDSNWFLTSSRTAANSYCKKRRPHWGSIN